MKSSIARMIALLATLVMIVCLNGFFKADSTVRAASRLNTEDPVPTATPTPVPDDDEGEEPTVTPTPTPTPAPEDPGEPTETPTPTPDPEEPGDPSVTPVPGDPTPTTTPDPEDPTPTETPTPTTTPTPTPEPTPDPTFEDFIERLYHIALDRDSEKEGKDFWSEKVSKGEYTGADCARFFLLDAPEFLNRKLSDKDFVETLYRTFFDRESEEGGREYWLGVLKKGTSKRDVVNGFIESTEWCNVCATYGVKSGAKWHKAEFASKNAIAFTKQLYNVALSRDPSEKELNSMSLALTTLDKSAASCVKQIFAGKEFAGNKLPSIEFVRRLYQAVLGREADTEGLNFWVKKLDTGTKPIVAIRAFACCYEFEKFCNANAFERGTI